LENATIPDLAVVTFSSDYGPFDHYVGVCHAVVARIAPDARVIDLSHGLRSIRHGGVVLAQSLPYAPAGVHLAIVDPGVGTSRRGVVVTAADGSMLVGPDNGLLPPGAEALGGAEAAYELTNESFRLSEVSSTFHGRDVFAPAAAYLANGVAPEEFGPRVDDLVTLDPPNVEVSDGRLRSDVVFTDWYGNVELAAGGSDLERSKLDGDVRVTSVAGSFDAVVGRTFADARDDELVVYVASGGLVAIACNGRSAAALLQDPDEVTVSAK
jgi:S-adenosylmethionine hydrolase